MAKAKYNTAEHKRLRRLFGLRIAEGAGWCSEPRCLMPTRYISPGTPWWDWDVPHLEDGVGYRDGPAHAKCNRSEGGRRRHYVRPVRRWIL